MDLLATIILWALSPCSCLVYWSPSVNPRKTLLVQTVLPENMRICQIRADIKCLFNLFISLLKIFRNSKVFSFGKMMLVLLNTIASHMDRKYCSVLILFGLLIPGKNCWFIQYCQKYAYLPNKSWHKMPV